MGQWRQAKTESQRFPRFSAHVPVRVSTIDPEHDPDTGDLFYRSTEESTANLSRGGAFVHSWEPLAAGRKVVIEITLPGGPSLQLVGQVAWTRRKLQPAQRSRHAEPGYGVEFKGGSKAELATLERVLEGIAPEPQPLESDAPAASPRP
jgi:Tfp pilus assembly protein PilZ